MAIFNDLNDRPNFDPGISVRTCSLPEAAEKKSAALTNTANTPAAIYSAAAAARHGSV